MDRFESDNCKSTGYLFDRNFHALLRGFLTVVVLGNYFWVLSMSIADEPSKPAPAKDQPISEIEVKNSILKSLDTISIAAGVSGVLAEVNVREGDIVDVRSPLARIRDDEATLVVARAKLALSTAKLKASRDVDIKLAQKGTEVAEKELERTLNANSLAPDTYPANEVDRSRLVVERSKLEIERALHEQRLSMLATEESEAELLQAEIAVSRHKISAPLPAMVVAVEKQAGEWVDPSTTVVELMTMRQLRIEGFVDASVANRIPFGSKAKIIVSIGTKPNEVIGSVIFVSPTANPVNSQVRVVIEIDNLGNLYRPGMPVKATVRVK